MSQTQLSIEAAAGTGPVPDYAPLLDAYHHAFADELRSMVDALPIREGDLVLEVACGDAVYARWLAARVGEAGGVVATDLLPAYLERARAGALRGPCGRRVALAAAALERMPFAEGTFDLAWCAQSLYSLPDPVEAVRAMARLVRPGGVVAVLENDTLHHVLLPWPVELELAVRAAELAGFADESDEPRKFYVGRRLGQVFEAAGLEKVDRRTWATNRRAPLSTAEHAFLTAYLRDLSDRAGPRLAPRDRAALDRLLDEGSPEALLRWPDLTLTCIDHVVWGFKPIEP